MIKSEWFDPHKSFLSLTIVWVAVGVLFTLSFVSSIIIIYNSNLIFDLSYNGFNLFISIFRFPLAISALIIPIIALLAANHRSEQTKEQIRVTNTQNVFSNYYKHIEEFTKYISTRINDVDFRFAHNNIYPNAFDGDYSINPKLIETMLELDNMPYDLLNSKPENIEDQLDEKIKEKYHSVISSLYDFIYRNSSEYYARWAYNDGDKLSETYLFQSRTLIVDALKVIEDINNCCNFSIDYFCRNKVIILPDFKLRDLYIIDDESKRGNRLRYIDRDEKTFLEANESFLSLLSNAVR